MTCNRCNLTVIRTQSLRKLSLLILCCLFSVPIAVQAAPTVSAAYQHAGGSDLSVRITVGSPPPASLIFVQRLPAGTNILRAQPPAGKFDRTTGEAKWLFRRLKPGTIHISIALDRPVRADQLSGLIRFKPPGKNGMESIPVRTP